MKAGGSWGHYVVGFFDLMGQSQELDRLEQIHANPADNETYKAAIIKVLRRVKTFRKAFEKFFERHDRTAQEKHFPLTAKHRKQLDRWRGEKIRLMQFADTVVTFVPLIGRGGALTISGLASMMAAAASTILLHHGIGVPVRGAIEIGLGTDIGPREIYGPVAARAYSLESKYADWPRILIGRRALEFISFCSQASESKLTNRTITIDQMNQRMAKLCQDLIMQDVDGLPALDYLGEEFSRQVGGLSKNVISVHEGARFAKDQHQRFRLAGVTKLALRYDRLAQYYESRVALWESGSQPMSAGN